MTRQIIGNTRLAQRTGAAKSNANFAELYDANTLVEIDAATVAGSFIVPIGFAVENIYIFNTTANDVTGGIKIGKTAGATDVVAAQAVGANDLLAVASASILLRVYSTTVEQEIFYDAVTDWNSAELDIRVVLRKVW